MRIGEQLLKAGLIDWETLALAVTDQPGTRQRLCSLLIDQGKLAFDDASRALGEQHGTSAVLERHLAHRDRDVAGLLPGQIAKARIAIPIGRLGNGTLIVCVRDPSSALHAALARAIGEEIVLAVCPASALERLVTATYATEQVAVLADADVVEDEPEVDVPIEVDEPPPPELELDIDVQPARMASRALPVAIKRLATAPPAKDSLDAALGACKTVDEPGWLFDVVMPYLESRWTSSLVLELRDTRAVGIRGHGKRLKPSAVKTFVVTIEDAGLVKLARDEKRIVDEPPAELGSEHEELATALELEVPLAAGLAGSNGVRHVLLLGSPVGQEREDALVDLGLLVEAMSDALARM